MNCSPATIRSAPWRKRRSTRSSSPAPFTKASATSPRACRCRTKTSASISRSSARSWAWDEEEIYREALEAWDRCAQPNIVDRALQFWTNLYLQDGILAKVDRASMMNSLEARSPFLDIEVANLARKIPWQLKLRNGTTKWILKKALGPLLPPEIIARPKK